MKGWDFSTCKQTRNLHFHRFWRRTRDSRSETEGLITQGDSHGQRIRKFLWGSLSPIFHRWWEEGQVMPEHMVSCIWLKIGGPQSIIIVVSMSALCSGGTYSIFQDCFLYKCSWEDGSGPRESELLIMRWAEVRLSQDLSYNSSWKYTAPIPLHVCPLFSPVTLGLPS